MSTWEIIRQGWKDDLHQNIELYLLGALVLGLMLGIHFQKLLYRMDARMKAEEQKVIEEYDRCLNNPGREL